MAFKTNSAPYQRAKKSTLQIMIELAIALAIVWIAAVVCGGLCGALNTYIWKELIYLPITGMGISLVLSLLAYKLGTSVDEVKET